MVKLLEGKPVAEKIKNEIRERISTLAKPPVLASIVVGTDASVESYIRSQEKTANDLGIIYQLHKMPQAIGEDELIDFVMKLNADKEINGIVIQQPLPKGIDYKRVTQIISAKKDIEGMHSACTATAVMELLNSTGIELYGKEVVVVGHSEIVGKPLTLLLLDKFATVTVCHVATSKAGRLEDHVRRAEVLIVAVGKPGLIKGEWIKEGAVVIDVGINCQRDKIVGDVEFESAQKRAAFITPVPGGVGPLTVAVLMRNLVEATELQQ